MTAKEIRQKFLDFFSSKNHQIVTSAPIVIHNDPTLLFTNAGMNQFKNYFLGNSIPKSLRVADTQKCLRVSGKHNDLEEVGIDTYHHTMFEMLGNWSFGDYFKKEAIDWAWELLTEVYKIDVDDIYVSYFGGDDKENLEADLEAKELWMRYLPEHKILPFGKKDNFWEMGETGPCGPCSEIHIDNRPKNERNEDAILLVNNDHPQVIEIWNLVFMQFNRMADSSLVALPNKHVDTGMGLERLVRILQNKTSNYDTDLFMPLIADISAMSGIPYGENEKTDIAMRVIADHIRAVSCTIADGKLPSNNKAGYVIRRILRRAIRYGYSVLNIQEPFIYSLVSRLASIFEEVFPEIIQQEDFIKKVVKEEELSFLRTLEKGTKLLEFHIAECKKTDSKLDGKTAFELYDTFGFPIDLTMLIAQENDTEVDLEGFEEELAAQKNRSKQASKKVVSDWIETKYKEEKNEFVGYDFNNVETRILKFRQVEEKDDEYYEIVLSKTPFYAAGGGQIGDIGTLSKLDGEVIEILDTYKENDLIINKTIEIPKNIEELFIAEYNNESRSSSTRNHSATHLLHAALRQVLGTHVSQKGSYVGTDRLRFDFSNPGKVSEEDLQKVEKIVNDKILMALPLEEFRNINYDEAISKGAMALFGEKYGDKVRMIVFDSDFSAELCGGSHVTNTSAIGLFKITSESAVAAGVRRIEAITGVEVINYLNELENIVNESKTLIKGYQNPAEGIKILLEEKALLHKQIEDFERKEAKILASEIIKNAEDFKEFKLLVQEYEVDKASKAKDISNALKDHYNDIISLIGFKNEALNFVSLTVIIPKEVSDNKKIKAGELVKDLSKLIGGGGGGSPTFATAGGKDLDKLSEVLAKGKEILTNLL